VSGCKCRSNETCLQKKRHVQTIACVGESVRQKRHVHTKRDFLYECVSQKQAGRVGISGWVWAYVKIDVFIPKETCI